MIVNKKLFCLFFMLAGSLLLSACATPPTDPDALEQYKANNDPWEPYNRAVTDFNFKVNRYVYRPVDEGYRFVVPEPVRDCVSNVSDNLSQPYYFVNAILQGEFQESTQIFGRFFTNTTLGIFGLFDVAGALEIEDTKKDFGETLYKWGWKQSTPYFVIPFLGPSDVRDTTGRVVGFFLDPIDYALPKAEREHLLIYRYIVQGIVTIDRLSEFLENIEKNSVDPYVALRTMYRQNRAKFLNSDDIEAQTENYNIDFDYDDEEEE